MSEGGRTRPRHERAPADLASLVGVLERHGVQYVVSGSVAALLHGVAVRHNDLDVVPSLDATNLRRLVQVLEEIEATPDSFGHWETRPDGERRWIEEETPQAKFEQWKPDAGDPASLDHLYRTRHGDFDVVPEVTGAYGPLMRRAVERRLARVSVWVAHVDDLLATLTVARRAQHAERVRSLREIQAREHGRPESGRC